MLYHPFRFTFSWCWCFAKFCLKILSSNLELLWATCKRLNSFRWVFHSSIFHEKVKPYQKSTVRLMEPVQEHFQSCEAWLEAWSVHICCADNSVISIHQSSILVFGHSMDPGCTRIYKGRSILVEILPKIATRCYIAVKKSRQIDGRSALCSLNVNKVSRIFSCFFLVSKIRQNAIYCTKLPWS